MDEALNGEAVVADYEAGLVSLTANSQFKVS